MTRAQKSPSKSDVVISGAGLAGASLALMLAQAGLSVTLIEQRALPDTPQTSTRTAAIMRDNVRFLEGLNIWTDALTRTSGILSAIIILDRTTGDKGSDITFSAEEIEADYFSLNVPVALLHHALLTACRRAGNLRIIDNDTVRKIETGSGFVLVTTSRGNLYHAPLLVGADGRHSAVRSLSGIDTKPHEFNQTAITCTLNHSRPHNGVSTEFHYPNGPFTLVPLPDHQSSLVWLEAPDKVETCLKLSKAEFVETLQEKSEGLLGGLTLESGPESWPVSGHLATRLTAQRMALIAEAAHVLTPLGAQGLNLSLRDVAELGKHILTRARLGGDIGADDVLRAYERARMPDMKMRAAATRTLSGWMTHDYAGLHRIRRGGWQLIDHIAPLKKRLMRAGYG